ncbi:MAG: hypothetical protein B7Y96_08155, partial [Comamonadaceae bacterium 32-67-11]
MAAATSASSAHSAAAVALPAGAAEAEAGAAPAGGEPALHTWGETLRALWDWRILSLLMLGFSAGLPL